MQTIVDDLSDALERGVARRQRHLREIGVVRVALLQHEAGALDLAASRSVLLQEAGKSRGEEEFNVLKASMQARIQELEKALAACQEGHLYGIAARLQVR